MSELENAIEHSLRGALEHALGLTSGPKPGDYPGGVTAWLETCVGMRMNEIRQWLHDPGDVVAHLEKIKK